MQITIVLAYIQPLGGGLLAIVPAPSGILAVGERVVGDRFVADLGDEAAAELAGEAGEMGFILKPLIAAAGGRGG